MGVTDVRMTIRGLNDEEAPAQLEDALRCLPGVVHVDIDPAAAQAHIWYDQSQVLPSMLTAAIEPAGYVGLIAPPDERHRHSWAQAPYRHGT